MACSLFCRVPSTVFDCPSPRRSNESYDAPYCTSQAYIHIQSCSLMVFCPGNTRCNLSSQGWVLRPLRRSCTDNLSISFCRARIACSQIDLAGPQNLGRTPYKQCAPRSELCSGDSPNTGHPLSTVRLCMECSPSCQRLVLCLRHTLGMQFYRC